MTSILIDLDSGDPYLDEKNNVVYVSDSRGFRQIIDGIFHCEPSSEIMNPLYGFDLRTAIRESGTLNSEMFIESLVVQALDPSLEKLISKVTYVKAQKDGNTMVVNVELISVLGEATAIDFTLI